MPDPIQALLNAVDYDENLDPLIRSALDHAREAERAAIVTYFTAEADRIKEILADPDLNGAHRSDLSWQRIMLRRDAAAIAQCLHHIQGEGV